MRESWSDDPVLGDEGGSLPRRKLRNRLGSYLSCGLSGYILYILNNCLVPRNVGRRRRVCASYPPSGCILYAMYAICLYNLYVHMYGIALYFLRLLACRGVMLVLLTLVENDVREVAEVLHRPLLDCENDITGKCRDT